MISAPTAKEINSATKVVVAHMGNREDGLCAVYLCLAAGDVEDEKIRQKSVALLQEDSTLEQFAEAQGLRVKDLFHLVNGELPDDGTVAPFLPDPQLSLLGDKATRSS